MVIKKISLFRTIRGHSAAYFFAFCLTIALPINIFLELFLKKKERKNFWRRSCYRFLGLLFFLGGLQIKTEGGIKYDEAVIYAVNHLSTLDGFIMAYIIGVKVVPMTGPAEYFKWPFSVWFRKMEFIDVQRSDIEKIQYKKANSAHEAIKKAVYELKSKNSILIFPEGHVSMRHRLMYFHSGPVRISLAVNKKIIPVGLIGTDKLVRKDIFFSSGTIKVVFGDPIDLVGYYKKEKASVKEASLKLKEEIRQLLPARYSEIDYREKNPVKTAVFINIDGTLYDGEVTKDFIKALWKRGKLGLFFYLKTLWSYLLLKIGRISKIELFDNSVMAFKGVKAQVVYRQAQIIFEKDLKFNVYEKIRKVIDDHKRKGHKVVIITNVIAPLARLFAGYIRADFWVSSHLEESNLRYTGRLSDWKRINKAEKIIKLKKDLDVNLFQSFAFGNDEDDIPVLKLVKYKIVINADDDLKRKYSKNSSYYFFDI